MPLPPPLDLVAQACTQAGWTLDHLDPFSAQLVRVTNPATGRWCLVGAGALHAYPLNAATPTSVAADKAHTYAVLRAAGLPVPRGEHFFLTPDFRAFRPPGRERADALAYAETVGFPLFVKPNTGSRGVFAARITDGDDLAAHLDRIATRFPMALLQECLSGDEFRLFVLDGEVRFCHQRLIARLEGDGCRSVAGVLDTWNESAPTQGLDPLDPAAGWLRDVLKQRGWTLDTVIPSGQSLPLPRANLSSGGGIAGFTTTPPPAACAFAARVAAALGLRVCGVDIIATAGLDAPHGFTILEANANPAMTAPRHAGHPEVSVALWRDILGRSL